MFLLKKIASLFLLPLTVCIILLVSGIFILLVTRRQKTGKLLTASGVVLLLLMSYGPVPDRVMGFLEDEYPPLTEISQVSDVKWIVVLGGGHISDKNIPAASRIAGESLTRIVEGIIIHRNLPQSRLLFSGGGAFDPEAESKSMTDLAVQLGIDRNNIVEEPAGLDTEEQAILIKNIVGNDKLVLITSAYHMPRSMALFEKHGMLPVPAPAGHRIRDERIFSPYMFFPSSGGIKKMEIAVHEYLGLFWATISGQI